jgi:hypothetical protein
VVKPSFSKKAFLYADSLDPKKSFYTIHSQKDGEVGRVILGCDKHHLQQLASNKEQGAYVGHEAQAKSVNRTFKHICRKTAEGLGICIRDIEGTEIIKNEPHSLGQVEHMDAMGGVWNFFTPLVDCPGTLVKYQLYQDYPLNIGPTSTVRENWSSLPNIQINWNVGDLLMLRSNAIHSGPPTGENRRFVLFGSETSMHPNEHTDTLVVTEKEFFSHKEKNQQKWY